MSRASRNPIGMPHGSLPSTPPASRGGEGPAGFVKSWIDFWFKPQDPTVLCMMRIFVGLVTLYTFFVHTITLQEFVGEHAWLSLQMRDETYQDKPQMVPPMLFSPLTGGEAASLIPPDQTGDKFAMDYKNTFGVWPPFPSPANKEEAEFAMKFRRDWGVDFRFHGLPFPKDARERKIFDDYIAKWKRPFPPPYPASEEEVQAIDEYIQRHETDPRRLYARGTPIYSVWMHVVDPFWMNVVQGCFMAAAVCFVLGLGTRVAAPLVWFANICFIHRNPIMLFGVDTMMNVLLLYLMIAPCGARLSLDSLIVRGWRRSKGLPEAPVAPSVTANLALRLMQVHLCIIYFISGTTKLLGHSWWNGSAVWNVVANYEFAPMHHWLYQAVLRFLGSNQLLFDTVITGAGMFTLAFEISYAYLVWRPKSRWLMLTCAVMLHGGIGMFMGLKTFSLMMIAFNMAFLTPGEGRWMLSWFFITDPLPPRGATQQPPPPKPPLHEPAAAPAAEPSTAVKA